MIYESYERNHVILPNRENLLQDFLNSDYKGMKHKLKNSKNSNSEDALTWSCFDVIRSRPVEKQIEILNQIFEDSFEGIPRIKLDFNDLNIDIGKNFDAPNLNESTEVDASIEDKNNIVFFEAKLYSAMSLEKLPWHSPKTVDT